MANSMNRKNKLDLSIQVVPSLEPNLERSPEEYLTKEEKFILERLLCEKQKLQHQLKEEDILVVDSLGSKGHEVSKVRHKPTDLLMVQREVYSELWTSKTSENILSMFSTLQNINSPYIVGYYGIIVRNAFPAVLVYTEYMDRGSMDLVLKNIMKIPEHVLSVITFSVLKGLRYLDATLKITHRNIKPSNILLNSDGNVKLSEIQMDIGPSQNAFIAEDLKKTYIAPERLTGSPPRINSDCWSLGITLIELATGHYPFPDLSPFELCDYILSGIPPKLPEGCFSTEFCDFVSQCLVKDPNDRGVVEDLANHSWILSVSDTKKRKLIMDNFMKLVCGAEFS